MRGWTLALLSCLAGAGCGASASTDYQLFRTGGEDRSHTGPGALRVMWRKELTASQRGNYRPVENAVAAIDDVHGRVYIGARSGNFHALGLDGRALYRFELHESIESEPALDAAADEIYVGTERGELYALVASTGKIRWTVQSGAALRRRPVLFRDALYVVNEDDVIESRSRADGSVLWSFRRERSEGFLVAGRAGLALTEDGRLLTGFSDGSVVALDALDGRAKWERSTAEDVPETDPGRPRYTDADATPALLGSHVYAASFGAGLYCLDQRNGSVVWREPGWTGVTGLAATEDGALIVISADRGIARFDVNARRATWVKPLERGSFGTPELRDGLVVVGDSKGSLIALEAESGNELGRLDSGHGFAARASLLGGRGFVLTNGGALLAMRVARPR